MPRRFAVAALVLLGLVATADAQPRRRVTVSFRACPQIDGTPLRPDSVTQCGEAEAKIYREAFEKDEPVVELVTMGVGALIWERHGHIALCVRYKQAENDLCYNYGIGNFHEPLGMAWGFFRGTKSFWAGEQSIDELIRTYAGRDRTVFAQPIPLDKAQKAQVLAKLEADVLEENKYYAYDHFWDNCTTRVRDILDAATNQALSSMTEPTDGRTYRDLAREGFFGIENSRPALLITDIAMGRVTDRVPSYYERMFLPDYLREAVQKKWGVTPIVLYQRQGPPQQHDGPSGRVVFALIILLFTAPAVIARWRGRFQRATLALALVPPVLLGTILWFLAIISPLPYVKWNESCLVFFPFDLLLLGLGVLGPEKRKLYARGRVAMLGVMALLMLVGVLKQPLLAELLWPLIPAALVGFWPEHWTAQRAEAKPAAPGDKGDKAPAKRSA